MMKRILAFLVLSMIVIIMLTSTRPVQAGNPPDLPGSHGTNNDQNPPGGGSPIASGLAILIGLGGAYAGKKIYDLEA